MISSCFTYLDEKISKVIRNIDHMILKQEELHISSMNIGYKKPRFINSISVDNLLLFFIRLKLLELLSIKNDLFSSVNHLFLQARVRPHFSRSCHILFTSLSFLIFFYISLAFFDSICFSFLSQTVDLRYVMINQYF